MSSGLAVHPRHLLGLVAVAEHGRIAPAADELRVTPRALSRSLRELERETGETLLTGGDRGLELTPGGRRMARSARHVLDALRRFEALALAPAATLRVAHVAHAGTLSTLLDHMLAARPGLRVQEHVMPCAEQVVAVAGDRLDVAVCCEAGALPDSLAARVVRDDPLVAIDGMQTDMVAAAYGATWPAFDACVDAWERAAGRAVGRVAVPTGCGRELAALRRHARGRGVIVASSALDDARVTGAALAGVGAAGVGAGGVGARGVEFTSSLTWRVVWRRDDPSPLVRDFVADAGRIATALGWARP